MKILLIEDDAKITKFIRQGLEEEGYSVAHGRDGEEGLEKALEGQFDVIVLDLNLPKLDGLGVCRKLRKAGQKTPVIMLTARDTVENRVDGLDAGADDYLVKPFAFSELLARLRALTRRAAGGSADSVLKAGDLELDRVKHKATYRSDSIELTSREFALLELFMRRPGHILSRTQIAESVWGYDFHGGTNVIDVYVNYLRRKLKKITGSSFIETSRSRGYSFEVPGR